MQPTIETLQSEVITLRTEVNQLKEIVTGQTTEKSYTVEQVATLLGISCAGVNFHIREGNIKPKNNKGRYKLITETELNRYIETRKKNQATS